MGKLSIEEKAQAYDKALERAQALYNDKNEIGYANAESVLEEVFPLLKESEDERIRKEIINYFAKGKEYLSLCSIGKDDILAWLEKQGEQKPTIEMKSAEESLGIDSETYNKIVDECIYGEQKPQRIISAEAKEALYDKPDWSEKDENVLEDIEEAIINYWHGDTQDIILDWLKSLRPQNHWKPSKEQMKAIEHICDRNYNVDLDILDSIYRDFKKLREE
jgi:hypothetical protein